MCELSTVMINSRVYVRDLPKSDKQQLWLQTGAPGTCQLGSELSESPDGCFLSLDILSRYNRQLAGDQNFILPSDGGMRSVGDSASKPTALSSNLFTESLDGSWLVNGVRIWLKACFVPIFLVARILIFHCRVSSCFLWMNFKLNFFFTKVHL